MAKKRSILVTGCSSGIGAHCACALRDDGWQVFATARKPEDIDALTAAGFSAHYLDYREEDSIEALFETVMQESGGRIDSLFNNGAYSQAGAIEDLPTDALKQQFEANVFGWHTLTRQVIPVMRGQGSGRIVQCSSILGLVPMRWRGAYNASKFALEALSVTMRMELAGSGIHVSLIESGPIESKIASNALTYIERYIDIEGSVHRQAYKPELQRMRQGGVRSKHKFGPEAVYSVLKHALESPRPKPHYVVTRPAKIGVALKRLLPARTLYEILGKR